MTVKGLSTFTFLGLKFSSQLSIVIGHVQRQWIFLCFLCGILIVLSQVQYIMQYNVEWSDYFVINYILILIQANMYLIPSSTRGFTFWVCVIFRDEKYSNTILPSEKWRRQPGWQCSHPAADAELSPAHHHPTWHLNPNCCHPRAKAVVGREQDIRPCQQPACDSLKNWSDTSVG